MNEKIFNYVYEITNLINGKKYRGVHSSNIEPKDDNYLGSNRLLKNDILKYGPTKFKRVELKFFDNREDAYLYESKLVNKNWVERKDTYNVALGGKWGIDAANKVTVKDKDGKVS